MFSRVKKVLELYKMLNVNKKCPIILFIYQIFFVDIRCRGGGGGGRSQEVPSPARPRPAPRARRPLRSLLQYLAQRR